MIQIIFDNGFETRDGIWTRNLCLVLVLGLGKGMYSEYNVGSVLDTELETKYRIFDFCFAL